ncbi:hypothetical protein MUG78_17895 [Gordonia alkaliphila]|uniref:hypothetical protein n=1 Tax=Gordonia alkaliphila TaxID=1053547 RepID=UPI001FF4CD2A|nr:hypothetical protein [Gordonia alkaliphila]MCK0441275.1 hypothetical protein [Gordonia alkaliphila]
MGSNAYADKIAEMAQEELPSSFALEAHNILPGEVFWRHTEGGTGSVALRRIRNAEVDNRTSPTPEDVRQLVELIGKDVSDQTCDPRYTEEAREMARSARADIAEQPRADGQSLS